LCRRKIALALCLGFKVDELMHCGNMHSIMERRRCAGASRQRRPHFAVQSYATESEEAAFAAKRLLGKFNVGEDCEARVTEDVKQRYIISFEP
jgi:hypothetical protein